MALLILDTDHLSEVDRESEIGMSLYSRLLSPPLEIATTIISAEEQLRGWLAQIHRQSDPYLQINAYTKLQRRIEFFAHWNVLPWDEAAAETFVELQNQRIRIGTMDLKIASIALSRGARLLSRNLSDFRKVPGLQVDNWLL